MSDWTTALWCCISFPDVPLSHVRVLDAGLCRDWFSGGYRVRLRESNVQRIQESVARSYMLGREVHASAAFIALLLCGMKGEVVAGEWLAANTKHPAYETWFRNRKVWF